VADHVGDSYGLAKNALESTQSTIVFPAVRFMAETAKILNPEKRVIDPNPNGGCSLADSISAADVWRLREQFPDHCFMCYINTTAEVKAACDVCVTSSNVYRIVEAVPEKKIYFLPDQLMGQNIQNYVREQGLDKEVRCYHGTCYVHEEFNPSHVDLVRKQHPGAKVLVHPECKPDVVEKADCVDSTSGMLNYVRAHAHENRPFMLLTECGLINRLEVELPEAELVGTCFMCKYMKSNSLSLIEQALESPTAQQEITLDEIVRQGALRSIENMFYYAEAACATG
jgi:quinolinate synthase